MSEAEGSLQAEIKKGASRESNWRLLAWIFSISSFIFLYAVFHGIYIQDMEPLRCKDGWRSSSIGLQGACSHHGGVDYGPLQRVRRQSLLASAPIAVAIWFLICFIEKITSKHNIEIKKLKLKIQSETAPRDNEDEKQEDCQKCPSCGSQIKIMVKYYENRLPDRDVKLKCTKCRWTKAIPLE